MRSRKGQSILLLIVMLSVVAALTALLFSQREITAGTAGLPDSTSTSPIEAPQDPSRAGPVETAQDRLTAYPIKTAHDPLADASIETAREQLKAGQVWEAGFTLLDGLHGLPDSAKSVDDALMPMHMLTFAMCSLMEGDVLLDFLDKAFDSAKYPIDDLVLTCFYMDWRDYEVGRKMTFVSQDDLKKRIQGLADSPSPLVRMSALGLLTLVDWDTSTMERMVETVDAINQMAGQCPDCRLTQETFRELLLAGCGKGFTNPESVDFLLHTTLWNDPMAKLAAEDQVVRFLQDLLASQESDPARAAESHENIVHAALAATEDHADPEVRDWLVRAFGPSARRSWTDAARKSDVRATLEQLVAKPVSKAAQADVTTLDVARAEFVLFAERMDDVTAEEAPVYIEDLLCQRRDLEPIDMNYFEKIPTRINSYAHKQINKRDYAGAVAVFQRLIEAYPNSYLARRSQQTIDVLAGLY